jgi:hypothetical protein
MSFDKLATVLTKLQLMLFTFNLISKKEILFIVKLLALLQRKKALKKCAYFSISDDFYLQILLEFVLRIFVRFFPENKNKTIEFKLFTHLSNDK